MDVGSTYQDATLTGLVGAWTAGSRWAAFKGDPQNSGTEIAATGGYTSPSFSTSDFTVSGGQASATPDFGTSTGAWSDDADYWAILDASDVVVASDSFDPGEIIVVDDTGIPTSRTINVVFGSGG